MASVLGRSFPERLLAAVADIPADRLADALRRLTAAGILESCPSIEGRRLEFRHALIRDAAYESAPPQPRSAPPASGLGDRGAVPRVRDIEPELLGHHLAHGGERLRAAEFFELAGRRAARAAALAEQQRTGTA